MTLYEKKIAELKKNMQLCIDKTGIDFTREEKMFNKAFCSIQRLFKKLNLQK